MSTASLYVLGKVRKGISRFLASKVIVVVVSVGTPPQQWLRVAYGAQSPWDMWRCGSYFPCPHLLLGLEAVLHFGSGEGNSFCVPSCMRISNPSPFRDGPPSVDRATKTMGYLLPRNLDLRCLLRFKVSISETIPNNCLVTQQAFMRLYSPRGMYMRRSFPHQHLLSPLGLS